MASHNTTKPAVKRECCSATVITFNEEGNIRECLQSLSWADEIVVVDAGSTDGTLAIAREFTERVHINPWPGMREQKNFASEKAAGPWIFNLDADERVPPELQIQMPRILEEPRNDGYWFPRKNYFLGKWLRHGGWHPDEVLRLFRKDKGIFGGLNPHSRIILQSGSEGRIDTPLLHYTYRSLSHYISKQHLYAEMAAREIAASGNLHTISSARIIGKTSWKFVETFVVKRGFLDGTHGLVAALGSAFGAFMKQTRLWEMHRESQSKSDQGRCIASK